LSRKLYRAQQTLDAKIGDVIVRGLLSMPLQIPITHEREAKDSEAYWALLQRVIGSPQLRRSARMREFLLFVGQRALADDQEVLHEQEIGSEVFGRAPGYDTSIDNIVRVNATDLRKRIEEYFATDGAGETLVFEIPRGSYKPVFRQRSIEEPIVAGPATPEVSKLRDVEKKETRTEHLVPGTTQRGNISLLVAAGFVIGVLMVICSVLWTQKRALLRPPYASAETPVMAAFWSGYLGANTNTDVILADTSFSLIEDITKRPIPLDGYISRQYMSEIQSQALSQDRREDLNLIVQRNYGSLGDFRVAQKITALAPLAKNIHLYYARDYTPSLIKQDNAILIGSRKSNPWVDLFAARLNFTVEYDPDNFTSYIHNQSPQKGELATYSSPPPPEPTTGYSVVAYLPNPSRNGRVLVIAGTGSEATEAAGEFLTSEESLERLQGILHVKTLPYFEIVLKTTHLSSTPMSASVVAYRAYPDLH
jgi:hypothetical protein